MSFDVLTPQQFEELVFELLGDLGAMNRSWRKGAAGQGSASDSGRDIECEFMRIGPTGESVLERRFVQCKHHRRAVSAEKLSGALEWADAELPDTLHIVASNFLSNAAKQVIASRKARRPRPYQILVWERPDLEAYLWPRYRLVVKYHLGGLIPELELLHPLHLQFMTHHQLLSLETLLKLLESIPQAKRDSYVWSTAVRLLERPIRLRKKVEEREPHVFGGEADYAEFTSKLLSMPAPDSFVANALLLEILQQLFNAGNYSRAPEVYRRGQELNAFLEQRSASGKLDAETAHRMRRNFVEDLRTIEARLKTNHSDYRAFCDRVLKELFDEVERQWKASLLSVRADHNSGLVESSDD